MNLYKTIRRPSEFVFTEKKSEFISIVAPVLSERNALEVVKQIHISHRKARHNCYAYIVRSGDGSAVQRYNDDGEPSGTAGMPILEVLRSRELFDVVCVVTRYFGGILLGAGGLTRAYSKAASNAVKNASIIEIRPARAVRVKVDYSGYEGVVAAIAEFGGFCTDESFSDMTEVTAIFREEVADGFRKAVIDLCNGDVSVQNIRECYFDFGENVEIVRD